MSIFGRGNINVNSAESVYRLNPFNIFFGIVFGLIINTILLGLIYWSLEASLSALLLCFILILISNLTFIGITTYASRLYLREEMIDMASMFASYNPQILQGGGGMLSHAAQMLKEGRIEATNQAQLINELEQLKRVYENLIANSQDMSGNVAPLANSSNTVFIPFIDGD